MRCFAALLLAIFSISQPACGWQYPTAQHQRCMALVVRPRILRLCFRGAMKVSPTTAKQPSPVCQVAVCCPRSLFRTRMTCFASCDQSPTAGIRFAWELWDFSWSQKQKTVTNSGARWNSANTEVRSRSSPRLLLQAELFFRQRGRMPSPAKFIRTPKPMTANHKSNYTLPSSAA